MGMIGWTPKTFWDSSFAEIHYAIEGFTEFNSSGKNSTPLRENELKEMMELYPD